MPKKLESAEKEERAERLKIARQRAGFTGYKSAAKALGMNWETYKAHEKGRNGFGIAQARAYARGFGVSLPWLQFGQGNWDDLPNLADELRDLFERLAGAPEDIQSKVISYAEFELDRLEKSREMETNPTS